MKCLIVNSCPEGWGGKETGEGQTPHSPANLPNRLCKPTSSNWAEENWVSIFLRGSRLLSVVTLRLINVSTIGGAL